MRTSLIDHPHPNQGVVAFCLGRRNSLVGVKIKEFGEAGCLTLILYLTRGAGAALI